MFDPATYREAFSREHGVTEPEWARLLPGAVEPHALRLDVAGRRAELCLGSGRLWLCWTPLAPRRIALLALPRLAVDYRFERVDADSRATFLRRFDAVMQRGGG